MTAPFLDDEAFVTLREYIRDLTGIDYPESKRYLLENRVRRRAAHVGVDSARAYLDLLRRSPSGGEVEALVDEVTTNETSFFRHEQQMRILGEQIAELAHQRHAAGDRRLHIWSAACSSGEEPYSVAILLLQAIDDLRGWDVRICGSDISAAEIERARRGWYAERQLRTVPDDVRTRFFVPAGEGWTLVDEARKLVEFNVGSLLSTDGPAPVDIVLCRNVLIYFDAATKRRVLDRLFDCLGPGGLLVLGPSDSLHGLTDRFRRTPYSAHNFYRKPEDAAPSPTAATPTRAATARAPAAPPAEASQAPAPARTPVPRAPTAPAAATGRGRAATFRSRMLVLQLDSGLRDLARDLDGAVGKCVERIGVATATLEGMVETPGFDARQRSALRSSVRLLGQMLMFLQVGDRGQQKIEAMRTFLQELSDRIFDAPGQEIDLQVRPTAFDETILPQDQEESEAAAAQDGDGPMSQDDIDSLFD